MIFPPTRRTLKMIEKNNILLERVGIQLPYNTSRVYSQMEIPGNCTLYVAGVSVEQAKQFKEKILDFFYEDTPQEPLIA